MSDLPTIKDIEFRPVVLPLARPMRTASGVLPGAALGLVDVVTDADVRGRAYLFAYTPKTLGAFKALCTDVKEVLIGQEIAPADRFRDIQTTFRLLGTQGLLGMLTGGIDMALWDALAKFCGQPACALLGSAPRPIQAYDSYGVVDAASDAKLLEETLTRGFKGIKIKLGVGTVEDDIASVAGVREIVGDEVALMVDYNQSLGVDEALARIELLAEYDITWIEEPVPAEDLHGHARVRERSPVPVQTGENWWFPAGAALSVAAGASDYVMPDVMKIGGLTGWMRAAGMAEGASLPMSSHAFVEASAHALAAAPTAHWLEWLDKARPILVDPYEVVDGMVTAKGPGLGMEWDEAKVAEFLV